MERDSEASLTSPVSLFLSTPLRLLLCTLTSTWAKSIEARRRRWRLGGTGGNENLRKGIYPTCRNISSARSLILYSDLFYASTESGATPRGAARLQFRKVSRLPRVVVCTPRVRDFGNLRESSGLVRSFQFLDRRSDRRRTKEIGGVPPSGEAAGSEEHPSLFFFVNPFGANGTSIKWIFALRSSVMLYAAPSTRFAERYLGRYWKIYPYFRVQCPAEKLSKWKHFSKLKS